MPYNRFVTSQVAILYPEPFPIGCHPWLERDSSTLKHIRVYFPICYLNYRSIQRLTLASIIADIPCDNEGMVILQA